MVRWEVGLVLSALATVSDLSFVDFSKLGRPRRQTEGPARRGAAPRTDLQQAVRYTAIVFIETLR